MQFARLCSVIASIGAMAIALIALLALALASRPAAAAPGHSHGLSLEQIRGVMRAHARAFNGCLAASSRRDHPLHGPFVYQLEVDKTGKVTMARPYQPSGVAAFDRCVTGVLMHTRFPGGPASFETPLVFDAD